MVFSDWDTLWSIVLKGALAYAGLVFILRISGKRTLTKLNAFDLVVTVALGSTLATVLLSRDAALLDGIVAFAMLVSLQFIVTWTGVRSGAVRAVTKSEPTLLYYQGTFLDGIMKQVRLAEAEILAAIRNQGVGSLDDVDAVVLETDGSLSVVQGVKRGRRSTIEDILERQLRRERPTTETDAQPVAGG